MDVILLGVIASVVNELALKAKAVGSTRTFKLSYEFRYWAFQKLDIIDHADIYTIHLI